ncbi:glycosyltransferase [Myxococcota bacterium]|nr:glycosyltransferase [Myxococcota bacterium]
MHVLQVIPSLTVGGAERIVGLLAVALQARGHRVTVCALGPPAGSFIEAELRAAGVGLAFLDKGLGLEPRVVPRLARLLRRLRPDVIHTHLHTVKYVLPARLAWPRAPVLHTVHNLAEHEADRLGQAAHHLAFRAGVAPVAIGQAVADSVQRLYGVPARFTIPNGVDVAAFQRPAEVRQAVRRELGLADDLPVLLAAGRLNAQKDHATLLRALADPALGEAPLRLLLAGEGELRPELEALADALGLGERVRFLGVRRDVPELMAAADAFVLSSTYEGNPLVVMEALSAGLPVVATAVGCVPELVDASTGALVPPRDPPALARALRALLTDLPAARQAGQRGRRVARERFDLPVMAAAYEAAYRALRQGR